MDWLGVEWSRFFMMIAAAGLGSGLVQALLPIYRDRRMRRKQAVYMAMRLAALMENFACACANLIENNRDVLKPSDADHPVWKSALPELPAYPEDVDGWRALAPKLAARAFGLENKLHQSQSAIRNTDERNKPEFGSVLYEQAAARRLEAWRIAVDLRKTYGIEPIDLEWDYPDYLRRALVTVAKERKEHRQRAVA